MNWLIGIVVFTLVGVGVAYFTDAFRYGQTFWLIKNVQPYEQAGDGVGTILVIGDSTGYGTGAKTPEESIAGRVGAAFPDYQIVNNSSNGRQIAGAQVVVDGLDGEYSLILLQIGANDLLAERPVSEVVADMQALIESSREHAEQVVVLTAGNIGGVPNFTGGEEEYYETVSREYDAQMRLLCQNDTQVAFVSLFDEPSEDLFVAEPEVYVASDGLHPTGAGYEIWFKKTQPHIAEALGE